MTSRQISILAVALLSGAVLAPVNAQAVNILGVHYYDKANKSCPNTSICMHNTMALVPAGKTLIVTRVSCHLIVHKGAVIHIASVGLLENGSLNAERVQWVNAPSKMSEDATLARYQFNGEVHLAIPPNHRPNVSVSVTGTTKIDMLCAATGTMN